MDAVDPSLLVAAALGESAIELAGTKSVSVIAAGKAAWPMAAAFARHAPVQVSSAVVAGPRIGSGELPPSFVWFDGGHPVPNEASERAGRLGLELARRGRGSTLVVLLSGGASAMLVAPADGITLEDKLRATHSLLRSGLPIDAMNCVRKHLSAIKGGQLAASSGNSLTLAISDVHGPVPDDPSVIGSGPTVADATTYADAIAILNRVQDGESAEVVPAVRQRLERGARGEIDETPKPGDARLARATYCVIGNRHTAMEGAAVAARNLGYAVKLLPDATAGEARVAGERFARIAARIRHAGGAPVCVIASGETTVRVRGGGRGGRNQEFALGMAIAMAEHFSGLDADAAGASVGTDGIDGPTDAAGALVDSLTVARAARAGLDPTAALARNDTYPFFDRLEDLVVWGPTGTNVGDLHVLISRASP